MGSSRAETIIHICFPVLMLAAGTYIAAYTCLWKIPQLVTALPQESNH